MRLYVFRLTMLILTALAPLAARGDDQQIAAQIVEKLQAEKQAGTLKGFSIDMQVDEGTVWLSGRVASATQQAKALDVARRIPGVVQVVNDLEIAGPPAAAAPLAMKAAAPQASPASAPAEPSKPAEEAKPKLAPQIAAAPPVTIRAASIPATPISGEPAALPPAPKSTVAMKSKNAEKASPKASTVQYSEESSKPSSVKPAVVSQPAAGSQGVATEKPKVVARPLPTTSGTAIGSGVSENQDRASTTSHSGVIQAAEPVANVPQAFASSSAQPLFPGEQAYGMSRNMASPPAGMAAPYAMVPVFTGPQPQTPLAFAPARPVNYDGAADGMSGMSGGPTPMYGGGSGVGIAPARYDHPQMPGYAWPSYASHPNYAAVTYPKQYSPTAWPYIGPFYPYPQVPLGWRKVTLEWDDGWWVLDFKDRRTMYNKH